MKKEILDELIKVANSLDAIGLYKEASNVDRIADVKHTPGTQVTQKDSGNEISGSFEDHIKNYKAYVKADDETGAINYFNAFQRGTFSPAQKDFFRTQATRIRSIYGFGEFKGNYGNNNIDQSQVDNYLRKYMLLDPKINKTEFDKRWKNMMLEFMYIRNQSGSMNKDDKAWFLQMTLTYNMLTQKFKR